ncbi:RiPP maturation radical SAM C-methyltransferase [Chondromyces crocatus]|uniref:Uncharacterized protein n=1 Tax=Chondromyces crocatus TaxID=52 RepID=A0A0K1EK61_CHOCO|nr:RiPP maturation radical SAM C-methyltransferase [Chondromyces crocatus]AKT40988.1 uncharacterized protein CMC5_051450 [Chondromyces crocatus]
MVEQKAALKVALVYPPYGPAGLPSLGLGLLSAGIQQRGFACRTFHWNLDVVTAMPGEHLEEKLRAYRLLNSRPMLPFNEWVFTRVLFGEREAMREEEARRLLDEHFAGREIRYLRREHILHLRERASDLVEEMVDRLSPFDVIGISSTFFQNVAALALARRLKARWPEKQVVLGGANCEGEMGKALLEQFPFVDVVFSGESDSSFADYVERLSQGLSVPEHDGIYARRGKRSLLAVQGAPPLFDLDGLPIPDFDDFVEQRGRLGIGEFEALCLPLESSRGCWWGAKQHCTFCGLNGGGMVYRQKSRDRFCAEIEAIVARYGTRFLFMTDNILSMKYYGEFAEWAKARQLGVNFFYEIKANVSRSQVQRLADAGINAVQPGIESFNSNVLALMSKGTTGIQNIAFLKYAREFGVLPVYNILAGFPGEDPADYERTATELPKLFHLKPPNSVPEIEYHRFSPYHQAPERYGIKLRPSHKYAQLYPFPEEVLRRMAYFFDRDDEGAEVPRPYLEPLRHEVRRWHEHYREEECQLTWRRSGQDIVIDDRRPGFPRRLYRLKDHAASLIELLDAPKALKHLLVEAPEASKKTPLDGDGDDASAAQETGPSLDAENDRDASDALLDLLFGLAPALPTAPDVEEEIIAWSRAEFSSDPDGALRQLVGRGLVYAEDGRYLSLSVAEDRRDVVAEWMRLGV